MRARIPACMPANKFTETEFQNNKRPIVLDEKSMEEKYDEEALDGNGKNVMFSLQRNPKHTWKFSF